MSCRLAIYEDLTSINEFISVAVKMMLDAGNQQWDEKYPANSDFKRDIDEGKLWVVEMPDGGIGGVIAITTDQYEQYTECGWDIVNTVAMVPHRVCVNPKYRKCGIGQKLYSQVEIVARKRGINILRVDTFSGNEAMCNLILKMGYKYCGQMKLTFPTSGEKGIWNCYERILDIESN